MQAFMHFQFLLVNLVLFEDGATESLQDRTVIQLMTHFFNVFFVVDGILFGFDLCFLLLFVFLLHFLVEGLLGLWLFRSTSSLGCR